MILCKLFNDAIDSKKGKVGAVFVDMRKAFDTVSLPKLILKVIHNFRSHPTLIRIIYAYLSDRMISIRLKNFISSGFKINSALPQGSVLSPILFSLFINDIGNALIHWLYCYRVTIHIPLTQIQPRIF